MSSLCVPLPSFPASPPQGTEPPGAAIAHDSPSLMVALRLDGRLIDANKRFLQTVGFPAEMLAGRKLADLVHPDDHPAFVAALQEGAAGGSSASPSRDLRFRCADGSYKWLAWQAHSRLEQGTLYATAWDISARKQEEIVTQRRARVSALSAAIWSSLADGASLEMVLARWSQLLVNHLSARQAAFWLSDENGAVFRLLGEAHSPDAPPLRQSFDLLIDEAQSAFVAGKPRVIGESSIAERSAARVLFRDATLQCILLYPIVFRDRVLGGVAVGLRQTDGTLENFLLEKGIVEIAAALVWLLNHQRMGETQRAFSALMRSAPFGICGVDREGRVTAWNAGAEKLFGWTASEVLGQPLGIARQNDREILREYLMGALEGRSTARLEISAATQRGMSIDVGLTIWPLNNAEGAVDGILLIATDLSDVKSAERRLALQQAVAQSLGCAKSIADGLTAVLSTVCTRMKWGCSEFWACGEDPASLKLAASWSSAVPNAAEFQRASHNDLFPEPAGLAGRGLAARKIVRIARFSSDRSVDRASLAVRCGIHDVVSIPIFADQQPRGILLFFSDEIEEPDDRLLSVLSGIAEQTASFLIRIDAQEALRAAQDSLRQSEKMDMVGRLVGGVAHDFNNLLTVILGYGELILGQVDAESSLREPVVEVVEAGKRASGLTRQLLAFCRKEMHHPVVLDINARIDEMQKMLRRLIGESIELETDLASEAKPVLADQAQLEQVILNLVVNARDAMPGGGRIALVTSNVDVLPASARSTGVPPGSYVCLSVKDTGCGMDESTKRRIFEPFFTTKEAGKGTGMGLATVQEIVGQCKAHITVESEPGQGTTFRIFFPPVAAGLAAWEIDVAPPVIPRGTETVLVVEDEVRVRRLMCHLLKTHDYRVIEARDAADAIEICERRRERIDLLLTDVVMPDLSGPKLAERIRRCQPQVKVLFASGYRDAEPGRFDLPESGSILLQKPFTTFDLATKVRETLDAGKESAAVAQK